MDDEYIFSAANLNIEDLLEKIIGKLLMAQLSILQRGVI